MPHGSALPCPADGPKESRLPSIFLDREAKPSATDLTHALGRSASAWDSLCDQLERAHGPVDREWSWSGKAYGWSLRLKSGKKPVVYLIPGERFFTASLALNDKASAAAKAEGLPAHLLEAIADAPKYAEGRALRVDVRTSKDLPGVLRLVALRMSS